MKILRKMAFVGAVAVAALLLFNVLGDTTASAQTPPAPPKATATATPAAPKAPAPAAAPKAPVPGKTGNAGLAPSTGTSMAMVLVLGAGTALFVAGARKATRGR